MRLTWLIAALALALPLQAQEISVEGGTLISGSFVIKPDTQTIIVPPPPWECPVGWTCTPPDIVVGPTLVRSSDPARGDTVDLGDAVAGDTIYVWVLMEDDPTVDYVRLTFDGTVVGTERQAPYTLGGDNSSTNILYGYVVPGSAGGVTRIAAIFFFNDGSPTDSISAFMDIGVVEPPVEPPDTTPPVVPPDTLPPPVAGYDSLAIAKMLGFAQGEQPYQYARLADYDSVFVRYSDQFWPRFVADRDTATRSDPFIFHTYYDRMMSHYEYWWRTGDEEMAARGDEYLKAIRDWYWVPNGYIQPRRVFPEGLLVHYYRTGDQLSFDTYTKLTNALTNIWWKQLTSSQWLDGRVQGRVILGEIYRDPEMGRAGVDSLLDWYARYPALTPGRWKMTSYCNGQAHFQAFHAVLYAMYRYNDFVSTDRYDEIFPAIKNTADQLWETRDENDLFPYVSWNEVGASGSCPDITANDLNGLLMPAFAWLYRETGDEEYRTRATRMLDAMLDHTYWTGSLGKQWNQSYWQSQRALYWLKDGD